ncbi:MAG: electron transfer flavoprotein subunit alpha/FixB family protein, partial [Anaerolineales bacterium]
SVAPRLAQALGAGCVSEAVEITMEAGRLEVGRYALGGNTIARERILTKRAVISVLPAALPRAEQGAAGGEVLPVALELPAARVVVAERREKSAVGVDISASERLVCVGRGLADRDDLAMIEECARALGADVACSRALSYEYGWLPEARMIGISGQKCSPRLLLSLGVSGQVQHTVGITGAHTIVAVNTDANAPIFKLADYGIVGDLYQVVPVLLQYLRDRV